MRADDLMGRAFEFEGGSHGCLLLHGFSGTPGHMRWLGEELHKQGYTVAAPLLPGHGATIEAMRASNWQQWLHCARQSYIDLRDKCEFVSVVGLSMGGALALILAAEYQVDSVATVSAALKLRTPLARIAPLIAWARPYSRWGEDEERGVTRDFLLRYDCGYDGFPVAKVRDLLKIIRLARDNLFAVLAPALVIQSERDETVHPSAATLIAKSIGSKDKQLLMLQESGHVCTLDCERERVLYSILKQLRNIPATKTLA